MHRQTRATSIPVEDIRTYIIDYLKGFYPDWSEEKVRYKKWD